MTPQEKTHMKKIRMPRQVQLQATNQARRYVKHMYVMTALLTVLCGTPAMAQSKADSNRVSKDSTIMRTVTVNGQKQRVTYRLDRKKIDAGSTLTAQGGTALDILSQLPSVQVDADGQLSLRGSTGFLVYVDGKPSPMTGTEALQMIPAGSIKDIEIMTTPSAKYKTDGDVGIINIQTKKATTDGWDLNVNSAASTWGTLSLDGRVNFRSGNHNLYAGAQASKIKNKSEFKQNKTTIVDDYMTTSEADGTRFRHFGTYIGQGGYEFKNAHHDFSLDLQGGRTRNPRGGDMAYDETRRQGETVLGKGLYDSHDRYKLTKYLTQVASDYTWKIDERNEINVNNRFRYDRYSQEYTESNMFDQAGKRYEGTRGYETEHHWDCDGAFSYKLNYRPQGKLEIGYQYVTYSEHGDYRICYWNRDAEEFKWQDGTQGQENLYAPFYYRRQTHSAYAQLNERFGPVALDAGLRAERLKDDMDLPTITSRHKRYTDLFPSAHVGYYSGVGTFTLGYSLRTNRPGIWKLEPYITYEDYYTRIIGNPDLNAEYIHALDLEWRKTLPHDITMAVTGFLRRNTGVVDYIRRPYQPGVTLDSIINAGDKWEKGVEVQLTAKPVRWWNTTVNASGFHYNFHATYEGCHNSHGLSGQLGWINNFTVARHTSLQFDGHLVAPQQLTQGKEWAYCYFDLAARQTLLNQKLSIGLVAHDLFHTARYHSRRHTEYLLSETWVRPKYPSITFSVTYHFKQTSSKSHSGKAISPDAEFTGKDF